MKSIFHKLGAIIHATIEVNTAYEVAGARRERGQNDIPSTCIKPLLIIH